MNTSTDSVDDKVSILLVNYKTRRLTSLCLSLIKEKFDTRRLRVIVVDNDSKDDSLAHLRTLDWIQLIERRVDAREEGHIAHSSALDLGLLAVDSKYVLLMHTDTLLKDALVIDLLMHRMKQAKAVCAGSVDQRNRKILSRLWRRSKRMFRRDNGSQADSSSRMLLRSNDDYIKSFCSLWDVSVIRKEGLKFCAANRNPGYEMQDRLLERGYRIARVNTGQLFRHVAHVQGGTHAEIGVHNTNHRRAIYYRKLVSSYANGEQDRDIVENKKIN